ncbi:MAG: hypothetical protein JNK93_13675, partial [Planctomycetia bacterium]|nr:hypothetical protein [Planctomycetia bacterium]
MLLTIPSPFPRLDLDQLRRHARAATKPKPERRGETEAQILADIFRIGQRGEAAADSALLVSGTAAPYLVPSRCQMHADDGRDFGIVALAPGCFNASLRDVAVGRHRVPLRVSHGAGELAATGDGLILLDTADGLHFGLTTTGRGPSAVRMLRQFPNVREVSAGFAVESAVRKRYCVLVLAARLLEISIVG